MMLAAMLLQILRIAPLVVSPGDTTDHVDLTLHGSASSLTQYVVATAYNAGGHRVPAQLVLWTVADTTIATITGRSNTALVRARSSGATTITAKVAGVPAVSMTACVLDAAIDSIIVRRTNPNSALEWTNPALAAAPTIGLGRTNQYEAINPRTGRPYAPACVHWTTLNPAITINRRGLATARGIAANVIIRGRAGRP